jgi:hypothetical protein
MSAGTTVWPAPFVNQRGDRRAGLVVKVYVQGKGPLPDGDGTLVLADLFTDDALTAPRNQTTTPVTIDANGNETAIKAAPGHYDAYVDGETIPVVIVADPADAATSASLTAEQAARAGADATLTTAVNARALTSALTGEATTRAVADAAEAAARTAAIATAIATIDGGTP